MDTKAAPVTAAAPEGEPVAAPAGGRGRLRIYLGATPGSGKTYAMLREGRDRHAAGQDAVIGFVETHGRPRTEAALEGLEVLPRRCQDYRGRPCEDMDLDGVLARRPQVVLVDELAHTNLPGARHDKRWQDVEELRDHGIDVLSTVNIQAVESVKDVVEAITGIPVRDTVPDRVIDGADEIHFVDISPEALRKRMLHGNIYSPEKVDLALANFFRPGNLAALREIALRLVAESVGRTTGGVLGEPQDVLVAISGRPSSEALIRRGARMARRFGGLCSVLRVVTPSDDVSPEIMERFRILSGELQCGWRVVDAKSVDDAVVHGAHELGVEHVLVGETSQRGLMGRFRKGLVDRLVEELPDVSVHVIARDPDRHRTASPAAAVARPVAAPEERPVASLRLYLGYARGCGITTAMLDEARRRGARGTDVVIGALAHAGRGAAGAQGVDGLEFVGGSGGAAARGVLDVDAVLERAPAVVCIDDLAQPGTDGEPAVAALGRLLEAGVNVVGTLHLLDLAGPRAAMAGRPALPPGSPPALDDDTLGLAGEVELVDVTPSVLIERVRRGEVVPPEEIEGASRGEFDRETLALLRELAFRVIAEHTDRRLVAYMRERKIEEPWEARPRVMTCVPSRSGMDWLIRRSAALARAIDGDLHVVTVSDRPRSEAEHAILDHHAALTAEVHGEFVTIFEADVAHALADYARRSLATEVILTRGDRKGAHRSTLRELIRELDDVDIHVLSGVEG